MWPRPGEMSDRFLSHSSVRFQPRYAFTYCGQAGRREDTYWAACTPATVEGLQPLPPPSPSGAPRRPRSLEFRYCVLSSAFAIMGTLASTLRWSNNSYSLILRRLCYHDRVFHAYAHERNEQTPNRHYSCPRPTQIYTTINERYSRLPL